MRPALAFSTVLAAACSTARQPASTMSFAEAGIPLATTLREAAPPPPPAPAPRKIAARRPGRRALAGAWPVDPVFITSRFGWRVHPITRVGKAHDGLDLGAVMGQPVYAALPGVVMSIMEKRALGLTVELGHDGGVVTVYGHLSDVLVNPGDTVRAGRRIASAGESGLATGPHLHFEVRAKGYPLDPYDFLSSIAGARDHGGAGHSASLP